MNTIEQATDTKLDSASKRALIETELRADPNRSDREIARVVGHGVDHKTVGSVRTKTSSTNSPEPTPTDRRHMLIAGAEDFTAKFPEWVDGRTAEQQVDDAIAKGIVSLATGGDEDGKDVCWTIPHQARIECSLTPNGDVQIWQEGQHGLDDDDRIHVAPRNAVALARCILFAAGFKSIGIYAYVAGGGCVDLEDGDTPEAQGRAEKKQGYGVVR